MNDPEAPGIHHGEVRGSVKEHGWHVKQGDSDSRKYEQLRDLLAPRVLTGALQCPNQQEQPQQQTNCQQHLPHTPQFQVFPTLVAQPEPEITQLVVYPKPFSNQAAAHNGHQRGEKDIDPNVLPGSIFAAEEGREEKRSRHVRGRNPEDRQLQMPGAHQVARQDRGQVNAIE